MSRTAVPPAAAPSGGWQVPALAGLLLVAGIWAYAPSFDGVLVLDDIRAVARNATIETLWPLTAPLSPPAESTVSGRPVANLSFAINRALASPDTMLWSYHAGNLLIHLAAALALFGVVRRTLLSEALRARFEPFTGALAFSIALVWVVHPLNTESVTYVVQRVESLMSLLLLLTLYCAIRAVDSGRPAAAGVRRKQTAWIASAVVACALGMGTKEVMVGAPLLILLWDWIFTPGRRLRWGLYALLACTWLVLAGLVYSERRAPSVDLGPGIVWQYLMTQTEVIAHYLRLAFVPSPLVFLYTWPLATSIVSVALPATLVCALLALTAFGVVKRHPAAFPGAVFFIVLAPTSSLLPIVTEVAAEHRMYLPLAAVIAIVLSSLTLGWGKLPGLGNKVIAAAAVLAIVLGIQTRGRNAVYASDELLWGDTVARQPANQRARVAYGTALATRQKVAEAEAQFQAAVDINGSDPIAQARLGSAQAALGKFDLAIPHLERALELRPDNVEAHRTLGQIYAMRQDDARALEHLLRAAEIMADDPALATRIAAILAGSPNPMVRDPQRAVIYAQRAVTLGGRRDPLALDILAAALASVGRVPEAAAAAREALPLAQSQGNDALVRELQQRIRAYSGAPETPK